MKTQYSFKARFILLITSWLLVLSSACVPSTEEPTLTTPPDTSTATFISPATGTTVPKATSVAEPEVRTGQKPEGGIILALVMDAAMPEILYAGTRDRGVFKSTDGGEAWNLINTGLRDKQVLALAIDQVKGLILKRSANFGST